MLVNNSSSFPIDFPNSSYFLQCGDSIIANYITFFCYLTNMVLLLPPSIFILCLGYQRWKQLHSGSSAASLSSPDVFTYNMAVMELIGIIGFTICICGGIRQNIDMIRVGIFTSSFPWSGQIIFPILICVEHYIAVVHPIIYMRLRQGILIRNISTGLVWLSCFIAIVIKGIILKYSVYTLVANIGLMIFSFIGVTFFCLSVLIALIRPRPGEAGGKRERIDQSKQRAVNIIIGIWAVLLFRFGGNLVCDVITFTSTISQSVQCMMSTFRGGFDLPCSLVLPLLFLHRMGKLPGCKCNTESG